MSGHKRSHGHREPGNAGRGYGDRAAGYPPLPYRQQPRALGAMSWMIVLIGLVVWSAIAWIGYVSVDGLLGWAAANAGMAVDAGKNLATAVGVGKEQVGAVDGLNVGGILGQAIALLRTVAKPAIVVIWALGALALVAAPIVLPALARRSARYY